ncbi:hypothetical protein [Lacticaseibacillus jixiensis]|uniref:hypothetical protein n=1 Tax=Lacticaseibacillus jixiensis TaxID=3231926 RepID=UPI0036F39B0C
MSTSHETRHRTVDGGVSAKDLADYLAQTYSEPAIMRYFKTTENAKLTTPLACQKLDIALKEYDLTPSSTWPLTDRSIPLPKFVVSIPPDFNILSCLLIVSQWQHDALITNPKVFIERHSRDITRWYFEYDLLDWRFLVNTQEAQRLVKYHAKPLSA